MILKREFQEDEATGSTITDTLKGMKVRSFSYCVTKRNPLTLDDLRGRVSLSTRLSSTSKYFDLQPADCLEAHNKSRLDTAKNPTNYGN